MQRYINLDKELEAARAFLIEKRRASGLSMRQLSLRLSVPVSTISRFEGGQGTSLAFWAKYADQMDCVLSLLTSRDLLNLLKTTVIRVAGKPIYNTYIAAFSEGTDMFTTLMEHSMTKDGYRIDLRFDRDTKLWSVIVCEVESI